jgi:hypothetical protein
MCNVSNRLINVIYVSVINMLYSYVSLSLGASARPHNCVM